MSVKTIKPPVEETTDKNAERFTELKSNYHSLNKKKLIELVDLQDEIIQEQEEDYKKLEMDWEAQVRKVILIPPTKAAATVKPEDLFVYIVKCEEPIAFADTEKHTFEKFVLVSRRPWEKEFSFSAMSLYFDDVDLAMEAQASASWFIILDWITKDIPMIMSVFTEKDCEEYLDCQIDAQSIKSIKERALTRIFYHNRAFLKRFDLDIAELEAWNKANMKKIKITNQKIKNELADRDDDPFLDLEKGITLKKWVIYILSLGWVVAIALTGILIG